MFRSLSRTALLFVACGVVASTAAAAPIQAPVTETIKDRAAFLPLRKYQALPGTTIGVMVSNVQAVMQHDGRGGPPDAYGFSASSNSYRWMYVPVTEAPLIRNLNVRVGTDGAGTKIYPSLSMANPQTV